MQPGPAGGNLPSVGVVQAPRQRVPACGGLPGTSTLTTLRHGEAPPSARWQSSDSRPPVACRAVTCCDVLCRAVTWSAAPLTVRGAGRQATHASTEQAEGGVPVLDGSKSTLQENERCVGPLNSVMLHGGITSALCHCFCTASRFSRLVWCWSRHVRTNFVYVYCNER